MQFIKTICVRADKETIDTLERLQKAFKDKHGIKIDQSDLIRKIINEAGYSSPPTNRRTTGIGIDVYRTISNKTYR